MRKFTTYQTTYKYDNGMSTIHYHQANKEPEHKLGEETTVVIMIPEGKINNVNCKIVSIIQEIKETFEPKNIWFSVEVK